MRAEKIKMLVVLSLAVMLSVLLCTTSIARAETERVVVSLGDSYSSGEGNPPFYGEGSSEWLDMEDYYAHRSTTSWPGQLVLDGVTLSDKRGGHALKGAKWFFYASSGAVAYNVYGNREVDANGTRIHPDWGRQEKSGLENGVRVQLDAATLDLAAADAKQNVAYVTMTIGGNDMNFAGIVGEVAACPGFIDRDFLQDSLNQAWYDYDESLPYQTGKVRKQPDYYYSQHRNSDGEQSDEAYELKRDQITTAYREVRNTFGQNAKVLVAGYPTLMNDSALSKIGEFFRSWKVLAKLFTIDETTLINENVREFNSRLEGLVEGLNDDEFYFVSVEGLFKGHEACTSDPYLNGIKIYDTAAPLKLDKSYSFHPNSKGMEQYRKAVQDKIDELEGQEQVLVAYLDGDKDAAVNFISEWYDDWTFVDGHERLNGDPLLARCPPLIAEDSALFDEFIRSCTSLDGKYSREVSTCVISTPQAEETGDGTFRVSVRYLSTQNSVDQTMYNSLLADPHEDVWDVAVNKDNKVTSLELVSRDDGRANDGSTGESGQTQTSSRAYTLSGVVRVHEEDVRGNVITVVSMTLDEPVDYEFSYRGSPSSGTAREVEITNSSSEDFGTWAAYEGGHIMVECESLQMAYHDGSLHNVDSFASGVRLVQADPLPEEPAPEPNDSDTEAAYTLRYDLSGLVCEGGNGDIGGVFIPATMADFRSRYGDEALSEVSDDFYRGGGLYVEYVTIPNTHIAVEYFGTTGDESDTEAHGIRAPLGELVDGIDFGASGGLSLSDLASHLRSKTGAFDVSGLIPSHMFVESNVRGLCYLDGYSPDKTLYYADGPESERQYKARTLQAVDSAGGLLTSSTLMYQTVSTGLYM